MAWTQADLDALDKAIALGAKIVDHPTNGKVEYRSLADMISTRDLIARALAGGGNTLADNRIASGMRSGFTGSHSLWPSERLVR